MARCASPTRKGGSTRSGGTAPRLPYIAPIRFRFPTRAVLVLAAIMIATACSSSKRAPTDTSAAPPPSILPASSTTPAAATAAPTEPPTTTPPTTTPPVTTTVPIGAGVPAYFAPSPLWDVMLGTANTGDSRVDLAILNPASGPGPVSDPAYVRVVALAKAKGVRVLGYVATGYGSRSSVLDDVAAYRRLYGITDIFLDEAATDCASLATYAPWIAAVRTNGGFVAVNPGIVPASCWADAADVIVSFEGPFDSYLRYLSPPWLQALPRSHVWNIVYAVPAGSEGFVRDLAGRHGTGLLYATDDVPPNPYDSLPAALSVVTAPPVTALSTTAPLATAPPVTSEPLIITSPTVPAAIPTAPAGVPTTTTSPPLVIVLGPPPTTVGAPPQTP